VSQWFILGDFFGYYDRYLREFFNAVLAQTNYSTTMKTVEPTKLVADPIITEVRRAKTALAAKYNFDVFAMVRALQEREKNENANKPVDSTAARVTPPAEQ
jgi:hypothetical protein